MAKTFYRANALVCGGTGCVACGGTKIFESMKEEVARRGLKNEVQVVLTGCRGFCAMGPLMTIYPEGIFYCRIQEKDIPHLVEETFVKGRVVEALAYKEPATHKNLPHYSNIPFYAKQQRIVLGNCGIIDPESIEEYIARDGYAALGKSLLEMSPQQVIDTVKRSGLRGLGGAGFPTGRKWESCYKASSEKKYVICNADEGDPGAFQDRSVLEGDPHAVLEGMIIAGYAVGAQQGYIYVRAEYPLAVKRLEIAIAQARENGFLGRDILGSRFDFDIEIFLGAGAFVCGESTALTLSIEGKRGMPKAVPRPRTTEAGLWGKPTLLNNVKTFAFIRWIINKGADWFAAIGTEKSKGTAIFSITGKIMNCGLVEVPMGITLREIIYDIGGGIPGGKAFKAVQTGGPSGGCLPAEFLDTPVDFDTLISAGSMMGSGGMTVLNENSCMVDVARYFLSFIQNESCGKCTPCREGTKRMLEILTRITSNAGSEDDIGKLKRLANVIVKASVCALGQTAPNPVLTTLRYFSDEYEAHIKLKKCPAGVCKALIKHTIDAKKCKGCGLCLKACPLGAITGEKKRPHRIDEDKCTQCGRCLESCKLNAIVKK